MCIHKSLLTAQCIHQSTKDVPISIIDYVKYAIKYTFLLFKIVNNGTLYQSKSGVMHLYFCQYYVHTHMHRVHLLSQSVHGHT